MKWRNVVVHSGERQIRLPRYWEDKLRAASTEVADKYANFDVGLALANFEQRRTPVPKEVTSLIAISMNFCRELDERAIKRAADDPEKMRVVANQMLRTYFAGSSDRGTDPWRELSDAWQPGKTRRRNLLKKFLANAGVTAAKDGVSAPLPEDCIEELVSLDRDAVAKRFGVSRPTRT